MDLNTVKGLFAENFIKLLMNNNKFNATIPSKDYGVDLYINRVNVKVKKTGKIKYLDDDLVLDIQIKCTTIKNINESKDGLGLSYYLKLKNYEDLIERRDKNGFKKLILIVFILPEKEEDWLKILNEKIEISKCAYWYYPNIEDNEKKTSGLNESSKVRITLLYKNKVDKNFLSVFNEIYADRI